MPVVAAMSPGCRQEHRLERRQPRRVHPVERDLLDLGHLQQQAIAGWRPRAACDRDRARTPAASGDPAPRSARAAPRAPRPRWSSRRSPSPRRERPENRSSASQRSVSSSLSAARRSERSAGSQIGSQSIVASLQRRSIMKSRTWRTWFAASCAKRRRTSARSVIATLCAPGVAAGLSIDAKPASRSSELSKSLERVGDRCLPVAGGRPRVIISGAVGRTELRALRRRRLCAGAALGAGAAAVGGPIEMAGIAGRLAPGRSPAAAESARASPLGICAHVDGAGHDDGR